MIGWHLRCYLKQFPQHQTLLADRSTFTDAASLRRFAANSDVIVHLAGQNRGPESEINETNPRLAGDLVTACDAAAVNPHIIYSSSVHIENDSVYGRAKKKAGLLLQSWAERSGATFTNLILPHIFGEGTRPFYNSAVATFAYQLAVGEEPKIIRDGCLELLHAQDVCAEILRASRQDIGGDIRMAGRKLTVSEVLSRLQGLAGSYSDHIIPDLRDALDLGLFNLHRSYLFPDHYPRRLKIHADERGSLVEAIRNHNGGQAFFSTTRPGITRGNHYHYRKVERFLVVSGQARICIRRLFDGTVHTFDVSGEEPAYIDMPPLHTHNITNTGDTELLTLFWSHEIFRPEHPDTVCEPV